MAFDPGGADIMPSETIKLGHHAHEGKDELEAREIEHRERVNPLTFGLSHVAGAAMTGAISLAGFGLVYMMMGSMVPALLAIPLTGALWYGGNAFVKAYSAAKEHNESLGDHLRTELGRGLEITRDRSPRPAVAYTPTQGDDGIVIFGDQSEPAPAATAHAVPHHTPHAEQTRERPRPAFLDNIIAQGPRSLSPKELAARIESERGNHGHTV